MKILYIGTPDIYNRWLEHKNPSHWLYGAVEMEEDGNDVIWEWEKHTKWNDIQLLRRHHPDIVFIPNLNLNAHLLLLLLATFGIIRVSIYAFLHHEPKIKSGVKALFYKILLSAPKHLFFLSDLTMKNTVDAGLVDSCKCSVPGWGTDMDFFSSVETHDEGYFVSTGKENRDFDILIEAFRITGAPLKIMAVKSHAGSNYEYLEDKCKDIPNIEVSYVENTGAVYPAMLEAMANAKALVCPLKKDALNYCVGLSTIADAEGLNKPLIITRNPYHDSDRMKCFHQVDTIDDWVHAIKDLQDTHALSRYNMGYSMHSCWNNMKVYLK